MQSIIRVGKISSINYATGKARVLYEDRDNAVTVEMPICQSEITGLMRVDDRVLTAHLSNGTSKGIIIGRFYGDDTPPLDGEQDKYRRDFSNTQDAYMQYSNQEFVLSVPKCFVETKEGKKEIIPTLQDHEERIETLEKKVIELEERIIALGG